MRQVRAHVHPLHLARMHANVTLPTTVELEHACRRGGAPASSGTRGGAGRAGPGPSSSGLREEELAEEGGSAPGPLRRLALILLRVSARGARVLQLLAAALALRARQGLRALLTELMAGNIWLRNLVMLVMLSLGLALCNGLASIPLPAPIHSPPQEVWSPHQHP